VILLRDGVVRLAVVAAVIWLVLAFIFTGVGITEGEMSDAQRFADVNMPKRLVADEDFDALMARGLWGDGPLPREKSERGMRLVAIAGDSDSGRIATIIVDNEQLVRVSVGDVINGRTVVEIHTGEVQLDSAGTSETMVLYE